MRKLTLLLDDDIYEGLHRVAGRGQIGRFVAETVRPHLVSSKKGRLEDIVGIFAGACFISTVVLLETLQVVEAIRQPAAEKCAAALEGLLAIDNIAVENEAALREALRWIRGGIDYADAIVLASAASARALATFDRRFIRRGQRLGVRPPVVTPAHALGAA